jgi:amino acid adenylation domain-containing protein
MKTHVLQYAEQGALKFCPDAPAIEFRGESWSFTQLFTLATQMAAAICRNSSAINSPVCVYLPRGIETIAANLGTLSSRNCYSNLDVRSPLPRTAAILNNLEPALVITSKELAANLRSIIPPRTQLLLIEDCLEITPASSELDEISRRRNQTLDVDPACIINTSGSTGVPKSVVMNHRNIIDFIDWTLSEFPFSQSDRFACLSPLYFDIYTLELYTSLATGACLCLIPDAWTGFPARLVEFLDQQRISFLFWVPSVMVAIANLGLLQKFPLHSLRRVFFAGEVFPTRQFNLWRKALPTTEFVNLYGPIEITVDCTWYRIDREFADDEPLPIGFPCRNTEILILTEDQQPAVPGQQGELCVKGSSLAMGYWNDPERTAKVFTRNPLQKHYPEIIYRTGDLASVNQHGEILFHGRKDYQIKHSGYRIELGEIENAAAATGLLQQVCVVYAAERQEIVLFYSSPQPVDTSVLRSKLLELLPRYMLPATFNHLPELPRNPNGKIDRLKLQQEAIHHHA